MAEDLAQDCGRPPSEIGERHKQFAALIGADRTAILASYAQSLDAWHSPAVDEPCARNQVMTNGSEIIADVLTSVRGGDVRIHDRSTMLAWMLGEAQAQRPAEPG